MTEQRRVIMAGATGMIGREVSKRLLQRGYELVVFSRDAAAARETVPGAAEYHTWQPEVSGPWATAIDGAYAVINMAGVPFFSRWKGDYMESRIASAAVLGQEV